MVNARVTIHIEIRFRTRQTERHRGKRNKVLVHERKNYALHLPSQLCSTVVRMWKQERKRTGIKNWKFKFVESGVTNYCTIYITAEFYIINSRIKITISSRLETKICRRLTSTIFQQKARRALFDTANYSLVWVSKTCFCADRVKLIARRQIIYWDTTV